MSEDLKFYRLSTKKEDNSPTNKNRAYYAMPEMEGYEKVYMPYGAEGRGFYYSKELRCSQCKEVKRNLYGNGLCFLCEQENQDENN